METYLIIAQMVLSVALVALLLLQTKGSGGLGGIFGQSDSVYRTRRGLEKTIFQLTIVIVILFIAVALLLFKLS
jgi:preprotein translocase subunit SecG